MNPDFTSFATTLPSWIVNQHTSTPKPKQRYSIMNVSLSSSFNPLPISHTPGLTPQDLNSLLCTIYDYPVSTMFFAHPKGDVSQNMNLANTEIFPVGYNGDIEISPFQREIDIDARYDEMKAKNEMMKPNLAFEVFYNIVANTDNFDSYLCCLYLQRFIFRALIDISGNDFNPLALSMKPYMYKVSPASYLKTEIFPNALMDVFTTLFGDQCLWDQKPSPFELPQWQPLMGFLAGLIAKNLVSFEAIRCALEPFRPTIFTDLFVSTMIQYLRRKLSEPELFQLMSELFPDSFLYKLYPNHKRVWRMLSEYDAVQIFPFVAIRCQILQNIKEDDLMHSVAKFVQQLGSSAVCSSERISKAIFDPILDFIYDTVLNTNLPYLEMTEDQLKDINKIFTRCFPLLKEVFVGRKTMQIYALKRIQTLMEKRGFEPKGLCFVVYTFLYGNGIVQSDAFNQFYKTLINQSSGKSSVLLEINSFLITLIPGSFPNLPTADQVTKKSVHQNQ